MTGKVEDGSLVTLEPIGDRELSVGDVVLVKVAGRIYLHLIKAIQHDRFQIGNNRGGINGWTLRPSIYGIAIKIER